MCTINTKTFDNVDYYGAPTREEAKELESVGAVTATPALNNQKIFFILTACALFFAVTGFVAHYIKLNYDYHDSLFARQFVRLFILDESSIPTWFSSALLLMSSLLLGFISLIKKRINANYVYHWAFLSAIFLILSIDDICEFHERLNLIPIKIGDVVFPYSWVIFGIAFVTILFFALLSFINDQPKQIRNLFILSGIVFVGGCIGLEIVGWIYKTLYSRADFIAILLSVLEELFEMLGVIIFLYALLSYLNSDLSEIKILIKKRTT